MANTPTDHSRVGQCISIAAESFIRGLSVLGIDVVGLLVVTKDSDVLDGDAWVVHRSRPETDLEMKIVRRLESAACSMIPEGEKEGDG